jgi:hypothetical protein
MSDKVYCWITAGLIIGTLLLKCVTYDFAYLVTPEVHALLLQIQWWGS